MRHYSKDSMELFKRPVVSLRAFSDSVLSFGCTHMHMVRRCRLTSG